VAWRRIAKAPAFPDRLECDRLVLRPFRYGDGDDLFGYANDQEWSRYITPPYPYQRDFADAFIEERVNGHSNDWAGWCIDLDDRMIGSVDLILQPRHRSAELAYSLARKHWNKGLMTEALTITINAVFGMEQPLNRLFVRIDTRNEASIHLIENLGFRREGVLRQNRFHKGQYVDDLVLALLRNEHVSIG
jgi:RimJ/RimL family protein N-acetyltransferase